MKLQRLTPSYIKYRHNGEEIDIPETMQKKLDVRGVWISNVENIDTPRGLSKEDLQKHLVSILDNMVLYNLNTAIFQVRTTNEAFYPSSLNPWSKFLTGEEGKDPGFDVFGYFVEEAKKRNIKVHAWMNPYRLTTRDITKENMTKEQFLESLAPNNWARLHPEHVIMDGANHPILAPSHKEVIKFVTDSILEVARNYDVEGVHIDDYFYPYAKIPEELEIKDYEKTKATPYETFADWRRGNVNKMIESIHKDLVKLYKETGKKVEFGISPFAVYRTHTSILPSGWDKGSYQSAGSLQCYEELYSDVYLWMKKKWIDYVVPQNYFSFERNDCAYADLCWWWNQIAGETKTKLYIGQALYHAGESTGWGADTWQNKDEIANQIKFNTSFENVSGSVFFTYKDLVPGRNPIKDYALESIKELFKD